MILLLVLAASSFLTGDFRAGGVMLLMVVLGVVLRFVQEARADSAAAKLRAMISVHATVLRDGRPREEPIGRLVPGDVVELSAGDMIPADVRLVSCKDLFLTQASLTGEAFPVEKFASREDPSGRSPLVVIGAQKGLSRTFGDRGRLPCPTALRPGLLRPHAGRGLSGAGTRRGRTFAA